MLNVLFGLGLTSTSTPKKSQTTLSKITDPGRENALVTVQRLMKSRNRIVDSYRQVKHALKDLQDKYLASKDTKNPLARYKQLKKMISDVSRLEKEYWTLIDLPRQNFSEKQPEYIQRVVTHLEDRIKDKPLAILSAKSGISGLIGMSATLANQAREMGQLERLNGKTTDDLRKEKTALEHQIFKLIKKYVGLRSLLSRLYSDFLNSKAYPIVPRYSMLKTMIKAVLRDPNFAEICHEVGEY